MEQDNLYASWKVAALEWGVYNEVRAGNEYIQTLQTNHVAFKMETTGMHINPCLFMFAFWFLVYFLLKRHFSQINLNLYTGIIL